jgi:CheY-like chemotaxis protein
MTPTTLEPGATHILLIVDDPAIGESLMDALKANGFRATWYTTGGNGLACARSANPHLILLDLRLPGGRQPGPAALPGAYPLALGSLVRRRRI